MDELKLHPGSQGTGSDRDVLDIIATTEFRDRRFRPLSHLSGGAQHIRVPTHFQVRCTGHGYISGPRSGSPPPPIPAIPMSQVAISERSFLEFLVLGQAEAKKDQLFPFFRAVLLPSDAEPRSVIGSKTPAFARLIRPIRAYVWWSGLVTAPVCGYSVMKSDIP